MRIIGLDLSLTASGVASDDGTYVISTKARGIDRLNELEHRIVSAAKNEGRDLAVIEGYSFGSKGRAVFDIAELGGVVRLGLHRAGIPFVEVAPTVAKKFATGKGNANKDEMLASAIRRWGFEGSNNNEADAYVLWLMGTAAYAATKGELPQYAQEALGKVAWPEMRLFV